MVDHAFLPCPTPLLTINHHRGVCHHPGCIVGSEQHTTADDVAMVDGTPYEICLTCRHGWPADALPEHGYLCPKDIAKDTFTASQRHRVTPPDHV